MEGKRFLHSLRLTNFLSYGPEGVEIDLQPLNVLIGPNTSGKSNLIEAIGLLRAAPSKDGLATAIRLGGGISEWLWKGSPDTHDLKIETVVEYPQGQMPVRYRLTLTRSGAKFEVMDEALEDVRSLRGQRTPNFYFHWEQGRPVFNVPGTTTDREVKREKLTLSPDQLHLQR